MQRARARAAQRPPGAGPSGRASGVLRALGLSARETLLEGRGGEGRGKGGRGSRWKRRDGKEKWSSNCSWLVGPLKTPHARHVLRTPRGCRKPYFGGPPRRSAKSSSCPPGIFENAIGVGQRQRGRCPRKPRHPQCQTRANRIDYEALPAHASLLSCRPWRLILDLACESTAGRPCRQGHFPTSSFPTVKPFFSNRP